MTASGKIEGCTIVSIINIYIVDADEYLGPNFYIGYLCKNSQKHLVANQFLWKTTS